MLIQRIVIGIFLGLVCHQFPGFAEVVTPPNPPLARGGSGGERICREELPAKIDAIIGRPSFARSRWGILVQSLKTGETVYAHHSHAYFLPASTVKLLTTAAALQVLGPDFRISTSLYQGEQGRFYLVGRGDPTIMTPQLENLAQQLRQQGIDKLDQLIADDSYFQGSWVNSSWEWEDVQAGYGAPINSLIFNQNTVDLILSPQVAGQALAVSWVDPTIAQDWQIVNESITVGRGDRESVEVGRDFAKPLIYIRGRLQEGSEPEPVYVAITEPTDHFLRKFAQVLTQAGIVVGETAAITTPRPNPGSEIAKIESPPIQELIVETNQSSNNIYAESLLRILGATQGGDDTAASGLKVVQTALTQLGVDPSSYILNDGSGLSRRNLVSPDALVQTLTAMNKTPVAAIYRQSLPVGGVSGTLQRRFRDQIPPGNLQAKTGTLSGVSALAGYLEVPGTDTLVFSIIVNQSPDSFTVLRDTIDEIVLVLARLGTCEGKQQTH